jgi:hypothetical protein
MPIVSMEGVIRVKVNVSYCGDRREKFRITSVINKIQKGTQMEIVVILNKIKLISVAEQLMSYAVDSIVFIKMND